jgi:hypothetical protein
MASLVFQAFGVSSSAVERMLGTIENMKIFLQTRFGNSASFAGGEMSIKSQGMCKGNGVTPAGWAVISICILNTHGKKGHGAKFVCPITKLKKISMQSSMWMIQIYCILTSCKTRLLIRCIWPSRRESTAGETSLLQ